MTQSQLGDEDGGDEAEGDAAEVMVPEESEAFLRAFKLRHDPEPDRQGAHDDDEVARDLATQVTLEIGRMAIWHIRKASRPGRPRGR